MMIKSVAWTTVFGGGGLLLLTTPRCKELDEHCLPRREFVIIRRGELDGIGCGGREAE